MATRPIPKATAREQDQDQQGLPSPACDRAKPKPGRRSHARPAVPPAPPRARSRPRRENASSQPASAAINWLEQSQPRPLNANSRMRCGIPCDQHRATCAKSSGQEVKPVMKPVARIAPLCAPLRFARQRLNRPSVPRTGIPSHPRKSIVLHERHPSACVPMPPDSGGRPRPRAIARAASSKPCPLNGSRPILRHRDTRWPHVPADRRTCGWGDAVHESDHTEQRKSTPSATGSGSEPQKTGIGFQQ